MTTASRARPEPLRTTVVIAEPAGRPSAADPISSIGDAVEPALPEPATWSGDRLVQDRRARFRKVGSTGTLTVSAGEGAWTE
ncbi:hypothetical protein [Streptosporangium sp. KLBMP 9127]|nr:hypothetical protein [Streptosporangium sp. KLBMP 9127]